MLVEKLKNISTEQNYNFNYGSNDWQNLNDFEDDTALSFEQKAKHLLLLWVDRDYKINDFSAVTGYKFDAEFVLAIRSNLNDLDYNSKYENRISKLREVSENIFNSFSICENWKIISWHETEIANQYDTNLDGLKIKITVSYDK